MDIVCVKLYGVMIGYDSFEVVNDDDAIVIVMVYVMNVMFVDGDVVLDVVKEDVMMCDEVLMLKELSVCEDLL